MANPRADASTRARRTWSRLDRQIVACERCPRLRSHCATIAQLRRRAYQDQPYWEQPVPNFGDPQARMLIVGLAPGAHGANRTGRMFTGDRSGDWLYRALYETGFASQSTSSSRTDGQRLIDCAITAVCHCAPPGNRPAPEEIVACGSWLAATFALLQPRVFVCLGQIAWTATVRELIASTTAPGGRRLKLPKFAHGAQVELGGDRWILGSYHPSQQNTFTGRLTSPMLQSVFRTARNLLPAPQRARRGRGERG
ncbi:MAG: uracil-DNA glycosylase [Pirellulales bacterium]|nr:uracil-DNA glycosylase [Pirellulales bacterium]